MIFFEAQDDAGDGERVMLNLIQLAEEQGNLERTEKEKEIRFKGVVIL
jgi:hypothetical protein